jgi:hypothetical protein
VYKNVGLLSKIVKTANNCVGRFLILNHDEVIPLAEAVVSVVRQKIV